MKLIAEIDCDLIAEALKRGGLTLGKSENSLINVGKTPALVLIEQISKIVAGGDVIVCERENSGTIVKQGNFWYWKHDAFIGRRLTDAEIVSEGLSQS